MPHIGAIMVLVASFEFAGCLGLNSAGVFLASSE